MYNTIYPAYSPYRVNNQIVKRKEDEEQSQSSSQAHENQQPLNPNTSNGRGYFPNGEQVSIDYSKPSVNISQIITDFQNTANAIGTPDNIKEEVFSYLNLIQLQASKNEPNKKIIQTNLKNASQILDNYITETLQKPSKVVENWIDALFLQNVEYKANPQSINPEFKVQIPEKQPKPAAENTETIAIAPDVAETAVSSVSKPRVYIPQDSQLKRMFVKAKKYSAIDEPEKALAAFKATLDYAQEIDDTQAQAMTYYEIGQIFDKNDMLSEALKSYNKAASTSQDENVKIKSHMSMAQIYDDVVQFEPAVDHYFAAIAFAGENENLNAQTKALSNLATMYGQRYEKENAYEYLDLAANMAKETGNNKTIGAVFSKSANVSEMLNENFKALDYYKESTKYYSKTDSKENIVKNYQNAASIMLSLGDSNKARNLLEKAYHKAQSLSDTNILAQITTQLTLI